MVMYKCALHTIYGHRTGTGYMARHQKFTLKAENEFKFGHLVSVWCVVGVSINVGTFGVQ